MIEELMDYYNIDYDEIFTIKEIKTNRIIGDYYFIKDDKDIFQLCRVRKLSKNYIPITVSSAMLGDLLVGFLRHKITIVKEDN